MSRISPKIQKFLSDRGFDPITGHMLPVDPLAFLKADTYPTTGTSTDSRGPGAKFGPATPGAMAEVDMVERFAEELEIAITELGEQNENANLTPAAILAQAVKLARQRMLDVTDESGDNGNSDPSLNPNGPPANAARAYRTDTSAVINQMMLSAPNGFEMKKRLDARADDGGLLAKLNKSDRMSTGGLSSSLVKSDGAELHKFDDGSGDADTSHIIREPEELVKRLTARSDLRKAQDLSIASRDGSVAEFRGSYSRGCMGDDFAATLTKRLSNLQPTTIGKLLH